MKDNIFFKVILVLISLLFLASIVSLVFLCINGVNPDVFNVVKEKPAAPPDTTGVELGKTHDFGSYYAESIVFLCDKPMAEIKNAGILEDGANSKQIWSGKGSDLPLEYNSSAAHIIFPYTGEEISITNALSTATPDYLIISIGMNNGLRCSEEKFKEYYGKLISAVKEASPNTKIVLQSILPVSKAYEKSNSGITNDKIDTANGWILEIAAERGVRYLNTASVLKDTKGYLKAEYDSGNGLVLNAEGYATIISYIRTHGYK